MSKPAFSGDWAIPSRITIPGLTAKVRLEENDLFDGNFVYAFEPQMALFKVDVRLPIEVQRYVLLHELLHAVHEDLDVMLEKFPQFVMTKAMYKASHPEWEEPGETPTKEEAEALSLAAGVEHVGP